MPTGSLFPLLVIVGPCLAVVDHTCFQVSLAPGENKGEVFIVIPGSCLLECRTLCETYPECSSYKYDIERTGCELYRDQANATGRTTKTLPDQLTKDSTGRCSGTNCSDDCGMSKTQRQVCAEVSKTSMAKPKCGTPLPVEKTTWKIQRDFPQSALVQCVTGHVFCGKKMRVWCHQNGTWEKPDGKCVPFLARLPLDTSGKCSSDACIHICTMSTTTTVTTSTTTAAHVSTTGKPNCGSALRVRNAFPKMILSGIDTWVVYSCSKGFFCGKKKKVKCLQNGSWEKPNGKCVRSKIAIRSKGEVVTALPCKFAWALEVQAEAKTQDFKMSFRQGLKTPLHVKVRPKAASVLKEHHITYAYIRCNGKWQKRMQLKDTVKFDVRVLICPKKYTIHINKKRVTYIREDKIEPKRISTNGILSMEIHEGGDCLNI